MPQDPSPRAGLRTHHGLTILGLIAAALALWLLWPRLANTPTVTPAAQSPVSAAPASASAAPMTAAASAPARRIAVTVKDGAYVGESDTLKVQLGDSVELAVTSNQAIMLHLHGYEVMVPVEPGAEAVLAFKAEMAGRFPVHEHREGPGNHRAVFFVEVHP